MSTMNMEDNEIEAALNSLLTDITALKTSVDTTNTLATELRTDHATFITSNTTLKTLADECKSDLNLLRTDATAIRAPLAGLISGSATWDPGSLADGVGETSASITATGAALGDFVLVSAPYDLQGITCNGYVDATNSVKIRLQNETAGTIDLASGTWRVRVLPQASFAAPAALTSTTVDAADASAAPATISAAAPTAVGALGSTSGT